MEPSRNNVTLSTYFMILLFACFRTILGMVTVGNMMAQVVKSKVKRSDPVTMAMYKQFKQVGNNLDVFQNNFCGYLVIHCS